MHRLRSEIEKLYAAGSLPPEATVPARQIFQEFQEALTNGEVRAAEKHGEEWRVNAWVKQGILLGFRLGDLEESSTAAHSALSTKTPSRPAASACQ